MSDILRRARLVNREIFDPTNEAHVESFKVFLSTGSWGELQFYPEAPYTEAPATVMSKFSRHVLQVEVESDEVRAERLAARNVITMPTTESTAEKAQRLANANAMLKAQLDAMNQKAA
jgi:hypothetical protein